jgi:hypothetical protein
MVGPQNLIADPVVSKCQRANVLFCYLWKKRKEEVAVEHKQRG